MPKLKRSAVYNLRNAIHEAERKISLNDHSQLAEWERDLSATACVSLWELDVKRVLSCLRRLARSPERKSAWEGVLSMAQSTFQPV